VDPIPARNNGKTKAIIMFELLLLLGFIYLLYGLSRPAGEVGERKVSKKITSLIGKNSEYQSLDGLILKTPDGTTQIDHLIVSPYGIFVIETKNLKGWIFGDEKKKQWTQSLHTRTFGFSDSIKYQFQNPLHQNYKHVKAVQRFLDIDSKFIFNVVVFTGDSEFKTDMPDNVMELHNFSAHLKSYTDRVFSSESVVKFAQKLNNYAENVSIDKFEHIRNIEQNLIKPICPRCGKPMILRTARKGSRVGSQFWGCPNFPACKATKNVA